jgi:predicted nucleic acid-binding protein
MPGNYYDKLIIADTSCLIALTRIGQLGILKDICKTVYITPEIAAEFGEPRPSWIQVVQVKDTMKLQTIHNSLDLGEASAIALALETVNPLLILDDGKARRFAKNIGIAMTGTIGLLITAYEGGFLHDIHKVIDLLRKQDFRLPADIEEYAKRYKSKTT